MDFGRRKLLGILAGSWLAQACYAVVRLGVPQALADGPRALDDLATATGAHPRSLMRLMRALAAAGLVTQAPGPVYGLTSTGQLLRPDVDGSVALNAAMQGDQVFRSFAEIMHTARTGQPAFEQVYGMPFYDYLDANPEAALTFNASMGDQPAPSGWASCDLAGVRRLVDVGGGDGALLAELLAAHPKMHGTLLERPDAATAAEQRFGAAGLSERTSVVTGSFFDLVPGGADAYVLSRVLHNWNDDHALEILGRVHDAMDPGARLIVLEELMPDDLAAAPPLGMVDLLMLVTLEGFDRTETEYRDLLSKAGFTVTSVRHGATPATGGTIEAVRDGGSR